MSSGSIADLPKKQTGVTVGRPTGPLTPSPEIAPDDLRIGASY